MECSIIYRQEAQAEVQKARRALQALRECNEAVRLAASELELLREVCQVIVRTCGYRLAWVGFAGEGDGKPLLPVALAELEHGYLKRAKITWADAERGRSPMAVAIRTGKPAITKNLRGQAHLLPWHPKARRNGFASVAGLPLKDRGKTFGALGIYAAEPDAFDEDELRLLEELADSLAYGLKALEARTRELQVEAALQGAWLGTINALAIAAKQLDPYTAGHQQRVALLSQGISEAMGLPEDRREGVRLAGTIHDLGKIRIPASILTHPGTLTDHEFGLIKTHPEVGYEILKSLDFPWPIAQIVLQHHERLDGSGYPQGLAGDQILLESRILAVADVVEAMVTQRPYRPAMMLDNAIAEITRNRGTLYDPKVVDACLKVIQEPGVNFTLQ